MPLMPFSTRWASMSPERFPEGRSIWVTSPVTMTLEPAPKRVKNIFIWAGVVFWASSRMMYAFSRVRPRM